MFGKSSARPTDRPPTQEALPPMPDTPPPNLAPPVEESLAPPPPTPTADALGGELERLREILYGNQSRTVERRLSDMEGQLVALRQELTELVNEKLGALHDTLANRLSATRTELSDGLNRQATDHLSEVRGVQRELNERLDRQAEQFLTQLRAAQRDLSDQMEQGSSEQSERLRALQGESRQRTDALRQELLTLAAALEEGKTSRDELGQMLQEMGQRLRTDRRPRP